jgi:hypothetical protein
MSAHVASRVSMTKGLRSWPERAPHPSAGLAPPTRHDKSTRRFRPQGREEAQETCTPYNAPCGQRF